MDRKQALKTMAATTLGSVGLPQFAKSMNSLSVELKGNINVVHANGVTVIFHWISFVKLLKKWVLSLLICAIISNGQLPQNIILPVRWLMQVTWD